jgi:hypothetical protein
LVSGPSRALVSPPAFTDERGADALNLDVEYHRLDDRLLELVKAESKAEELRAVLRERDQIGAEREAFRRSVAALHEQTRHARPA